jgi:GTPase SAR1 family protein
MRKKILIMGLPGAGKTTLVRHLAPRLNAVHYNADDVRANVNRDLGFSESDRVEHARRMGWLCDQVVKAGCFALADFICPTPRIGTHIRADFPDRPPTTSRNYLQTQHIIPSRSRKLPADMTSSRIVSMRSSGALMERITSSLRCRLQTFQACAAISASPTSILRVPIGKKPMRKGTS